MKGIILAGDSGSRLHPLTLSIPKQLLPVYNKPMIYYPLSTLIRSGVKDILIITTKDYQASFQKCLSGLVDDNIHLSYTYQENPEGVAQAIMIGQEFIGEDSLCLITGDTLIIGSSLYKQLDTAFKAAEKSGQATIFVDQDYDPNQYGVVVLGNKGAHTQILSQSNKPNYYSITGLYVFPNVVLKHVFQVEKSERNRYEITSVSKVFHESNKLQIQKLGKDCVWLDTTTFDNILKSSQYIQNIQKECLS